MVGAAVDRPEQTGRVTEAASTRDVRSGDVQRARLLSRRRKLFAPPDRAKSGRASADLVRLSARRHFGGDRRKPPIYPADSRNVQRRPFAQAEPGRFRLPPPFGARQPSVEIRGVGEAGRTGDLRLGDSRAVRVDEIGRRGDRADYSPDGTARSRSRSPPYTRPDR